MRKLSAKLTYANVIATLALFVALGGVGYAATKLPKNSVHTKQLANGSVTSPKVKDGTLSRADLAAGVLPNPVDLSNFYDKSATDARFYDKSATDARFYDKSASDARFLGANGTAVNSSGLGSFPATAFPVSVRDEDTVASTHAVLGFGRRSIAGGAGPTTILDVGLLGEVRANCSDPAQPSIFFRNTQQSSVDVWTQNMITGGLSYASVGAESNSASVTGSGAVQGANRFSFIVGSGATAGSGIVAAFDVTSVTAPGGVADNSCLVQVQSQSLTS